MEDNLKGTMVEGLLYEGSAEKTVILNILESITNLPMSLFLKDEHKEKVSDLINYLWLNDDIWAQLDDSIYLTYVNLNISKFIEQVVNKYSHHHNVEKYVLKELTDDTVGLTDSQIAKLLTKNPYKALELINSYCLEFNIELDLFG